MSLKRLVGEFKPQKKGIGKVLGHLEADVMEVIWRRGDVSVREVHEELCLKREIAYTTVMTIMSRLADKKILKKEKTGIAYQYTPVYSKEEFTGIFVGEVMDGLLEEYADFAYLHLLKRLHKHDEAAIDELEKLVKEQLRKDE